MKLQLLLSCCLFLVIAVHPFSVEAVPKKKIADIATRDGRVFRHIKAVIPQGDILLIITRTGEHKVDFRQVPSHIQQQYKYNPAKAAKVRASKRQAEKTARQRAHKEQQNYLAKYKEIVSNGKLFVVTKKYTLTRKHGGFIHLKPLSVLPIHHDTAALKGELFTVNHKYLTPMDQYLGSLQAEKKKLQHQIVSIPKDIVKLQQAHHEATAKLSELMATRKTVYTQFNNGNQTTPGRVIQYDPLVLKQITALRREIKTIKKQLRIIAKKDPEEMKTTIEEIDADIAAIDRNSFRYIAKRNLKKEHAKPTPVAVGNLKPNQPQGKKNELKARLKALKEMFKSDLITREEYKKKKQEILSEL